jgi:hypothetical protein
VRNERQIRLEALHILEVSKVISSGMPTYIKTSFEKTDTVFIPLVLMTLESDLSKIRMLVS